MVRDELIMGLQHNEAVPTGQFGDYSNPHPHNTGVGIEMRQSLCCLLER